MRIVQNTWSWDSQSTLIYTSDIMHVFYAYAIGFISIVVFILL